MKLEKLYGCRLKGSFLDSESIRLDFRDDEEKDYSLLIEPSLFKHGSGGVKPYSALLKAKIIAMEAVTKIETTETEIPLA